MGARPVSGPTTHADGSPVVTGAVHADLARSAGPDTRAGRPPVSVTARRIAAVLVAAGLAAGCGAEPAAEPIPTTRPILTTQQTSLTTTTIAAPPPQRRIYVVQPGDTLSKIANGFGVSVQALMDENGKDDTLLRIGEQLVIPPTAVGASGSP